MVLHMFLERGKQLPIFVLNCKAENTSTLTNSSAVVNAHNYIKKDKYHIGFVFFVFVLVTFSPAYYSAAGTS